MDLRYQNIKLICFPYAGGNQYSYVDLKKFLNPKIELISYELPGRTSKSEQPLIRDLYKMAEYLLEEMELDHPFAFFGHSMGTKLVSIITRQLNEENLPLPIHLFCTGTEAPTVPKKKAIHNLENEAFLAEIRRLGGFPDSLLQNTDFMQYVEPILRADMEAVETTVIHLSTDKSYNVPITVITGKDEEHTKNGLLAWRDETTNQVQFQTFSGNHFFIFDHLNKLAEVINDTLRPKLQADGISYKEINQVSL